MDRIQDGGRHAWQAYPGGTRRGVMQALTLATGGLSLAACAGSGPATTDRAAPAPAKPVGPVTLWHNWGLRTPALKTHLAQFEQANPGVTVEETTQSSAFGSDQIVAAILAGTPPDCLNIFPAMYLLLVPAKAVVDLKAYLARDKIDPRLIIELDLKTRTIDDRLIALPAISGTSGITFYWNKDHFRQAGLDPQTPPKSWSDIAQYARRLTVRQGDTVERLGIEPINGSGNVKIDTGARFVAWLYNNDGRLLSEDGRKVAFNAKEGVDTLTWLSQLVRGQGAGPLYDVGGARTAFYQGKLSMLPEQDLLPSLIRLDPVGKEMSWGIASLPANDRNPRAKSLVGNRGGHGYAVLREAKNLEGGWALTRFLAVGDAQCAFMVDYQGRFSTLKRCNTSPEALKLPEFQVFSRQADASPAVPFAPGDPGAVQALEARVQDALAGKLSPEAALQQAAQEAQLALDDGWRRWSR